MGKGDIKTKRGKIFAGSYGVRRPKKKKKREKITVAKAKKTVTKTQKATAKPTKKQPQESKATSAKQEITPELAAEYEKIMGKKVYYGWTAEQVKEKMAEAKKEA